VNAAGVIAGFSSHGYSSDGDVKPDACARGESTVIVDLNGTIQTGNGTSFASPVLCGAVACLWQAHPTMSGMTIVNTVRQSGSMYSAPDSSYGYGIPDLCAANLYLSGSSFVPGEEDQLVEISSNPFTSSFSFSFYAAKEQDITVRITDMRGRLITEQVMFAAAGAMNYYTINQLETLSDGLYVLSVITDKTVITRNIVKKGE
jgi:hypothetical protein